MLADSMFLNQLYGSMRIAPRSMQGIAVGWFPRQDPFHLIYRDRNNNIYDTDWPVARMENGESSVDISDMILEPAAGRSVWHFARISVSCYGVISETSEDCLVTVDSDAVMVEPCGNPPHQLHAQPIKGGKIKLSWLYSSVDEDATPDGFKIYRESDIAGVWVLDGNRNFGDRRGKYYEWESSDLSDAHNYKFIVRAYRDVGGTDYEEVNDIVTEATADSTGPVAISTITVSVET